MKIILGISLVTNLILGYFLLVREEEKDVVERLIIETHAEAPKMEAPVSIKSPDSANPAVVLEESKNDIDPPDFVNLDPRELRDDGEKMEADRSEFLTDKLGVSEEKIAEHQKIRNEFFNKSAKFWGTNPMRELTFKQRRQMLELEEEFHTKLEKLYGKETWKNYQKYRQDYNSKGYKRQMEDGRPFIFMGP